jgi:ABC-2 type transport system permease protein
MLSPALRWPGWVTDLSPWSHLTLVPLQDFATTAGIVMTVLGFGLALVGVLAFGRRDVVGA